MAASVLRYQQHCEALTLKESLRRLPGMAAASSALSSALSGALRQQARGSRLRRNNSFGDITGKVEQQQLQSGGHRRSASHTSVYPVSAQALAPAKRLRRDKTRSFDCALLSGAWAEDCGSSSSSSCCAASLGGSESGHVSDASSEVSSSSEYVIDPALEAMLSSQFEAAGFPVEAAKQQQQQQQPALEQQGDEPRRRKKKSKHHRRSKSILFRSDESVAAEEELAANLDMAFDEFDFSGGGGSDSDSFESVLARTISKKDGPGAARGLGLPIILE